MLTWDVNDKYPVQHGIHARKVGFMLRPAAMDENGNYTEEVVAKALSYSKKNTTADILLHPMNCCLPPTAGGAGGGAVGGTGGGTEDEEGDEEAKTNEGG